MLVALFYPERFDKPRYEHNPGQELDINDDDDDGDDDDAEEFVQFLNGQAVSSRCPASYKSRSTKSEDHMPSKVRLCHPNELSWLFLTHLFEVPGQV
jgi:hypothetical protein